MRLEVVEAALARLETSGAVVRGAILTNGRMIEIWRRA